MVTKEQKILAKELYEKEINNIPKIVEKIYTVNGVTKRLRITPSSLNKYRNNKSKPSLTVFMRIMQLYKEIEKMV
ncbi:MAG: hypothetical protein QXV17_01400 [Candidatus Micrarchaeaceae archaeon]